MRNKILISSILTALIFIFTLFISNNVYAESDDWTYEERMATKTKFDFETTTFINQFYATRNMDAPRVIKQYQKDLVWLGIGPCYEPENDIYMDFGEYPADTSIIVLQPHLGQGRDVYSQGTRAREIESFDGKAEYIIGFNQYDQIMIILDGNTFKGNVGDIINDFFLNVVTDNSYRVEHEFTCDYASCAKEGGCITTSRYRQGEDIYMASCLYEVGFNLTKEAPQTPVDNNLEDPAIYGGNETVTIDDTPTQAPEVNEYDPWKVLGIVGSSLISLVGIYLIYLLGKKIYLTMKGQ